MLPVPPKGCPSIAVFEGWEFVRRPARKPKSLRHIHESSGRENRDGSAAYEVEGLATDVARQISSALQEKNGLAGKKIGEAIAGGKWREHKESVGGDALHGIDLVAAEASAKLDFIAAKNPA